MEFGLGKCIKATIVCGKLLKAKNITLGTLTDIKDLESKEGYKYLEWDISFPVREKILERMLS